MAHSNSRTMTLAAIVLLSVGATSALTNPQGFHNAVANVIGEAAHAQSVGKLAQKLQGKPVVVDIYASWCPACRNISPTLSQLKQQYAGKVNFVKLDVTDGASTDKSEAMARDLGLSAFFVANKTQTGSITIIDPSTGKILAQQRNNPNKSAYATVLDAAISNR